MLKNKNGITLIALIITIIILLLLAGITISSLTGSGLFEKTIKAADKSKISEYKEKIELIKMELLIEKNGVPPTIQEIKQELDKDNYKAWVNSTRFITDNDIEKLELTTKEGYIFYITSEKTQYKGAGEVVDTSALQRDDVISIQTVEVGDTINKVKITDLSGVDYYKLKYQIGTIEGEWTEIESGDILEVPYGTTIYARLEYETEVGQNHQISISDTMPKIVAQDVNTSGLIRKTDKSMAELFEITWGSDGTGTIAYEITGNLTFDNTRINSTEIDNLSELELGTYTIKCTITSPKNNVATASKTDVKVTTLKETTVENSSGTNIEGYAIYSEYDLAYFRDLVNGGQPTLNAKLMNDIDLANVCSLSIGNWIPIGNNGINENLVFNGTFEGNIHTISGLYINGATIDGQGLFGKNQGTIQNLKLENANINTSSNNTGILVGYNDSTGIISYIETSGNITSTNNRTGGIVGYNFGEITVVTNDAIVSGDSYVGGITGYNTGGSITKSRNYATIISSVKFTGGITGVNNENSRIEECYNLANINSTGYYVGGISGVNQFSSSILNCYNTGMIVCTGKNPSSNDNGIVGGISGGNRYTSTIQYCYNTGNVTGSYRYVGGIVAHNGADGAGTQTVNNVFNTGIITKSTTTASSNIGESSNDYVGYLIGRYGSLTGKYENTNQTTMSSWSIENINTNLSNKFTNDFQNEDKTWKYNNGYPVLIWQLEN